MLWGNHTIWYDSKHCLKTMAAKAEDLYNIRTVLQ